MSLYLRRWFLSIINFFSFYQYINLLKKEGPCKDSFEEMKCLKEMNFRFKDKVPPMSYVISLASNISVSVTSTKLILKKLNRFCRFY